MYYEHDFKKLQVNMKYGLKLSKIKVCHENYAKYRTALIL